MTHYQCVLLCLGGDWIYFIGRGPTRGSAYADARAEQGRCKTHEQAFKCALAQVNGLVRMADKRASPAREGPRRGKPLTYPAPLGSDGAW